MIVDNVDKEIIKIISENPEISPGQIAEVLQIDEDVVRNKIKILNDTRQKILIVDDELDALFILRKALESENYQVTEASNGQEAIEITLSSHPDLILLDLMMPGMDGIEVCRTLKGDDFTSHIPIIMLTAKGDVDEKIQGIETGADDYVTKPFDLGELRARIKMILRRSRI